MGEHILAVGATYIAASQHLPICLRLWIALGKQWNERDTHGFSER